MFLLRHCNVVHTHLTNFQTLIKTVASVIWVSKHLLFALYLEMSKRVTSSQPAATRGVDKLPIQPNYLSGGPTQPI